MVNVSVVVMRTQAFYVAKATEMEQLATLRPPGGEREALLKTAAHLRDLAGLAAWREREPPTARAASSVRPGV